jgi:eukaryotic-like serine/threonine-protein kinase
MRPALMPCPDDAVLVELAEGRVIGDDARDAIEEHLDGCAMCREVVAEVGRAASPAEISSDGAVVATSTLEPGVRLGRYTLLHALGSGAMGIVYAAHDARLDRRVALKLLRRDLALRAPNVKARLLREAQAIARLAHPNVVTVYDAAVIDDDVVIAMELVSGGTLAGLLRARGAGMRARLELFLQAGQGLAAAHEAGIVHRDFKPDNVLVTEGGRALVSDFGLAQITAGEPSAGAPRDEAAALVVTRTGARLGTPAYMAPEQHAGLATDARTDQFSFCVALHEALYGERPFVGATPAALSCAVSLGAVRPAPRGSRVPTRVRRALLRGLSVDPAARYPSMIDLLADLAPRRRSWIAAGIAVVVGAVAVAAIVTGAAARRPPDPAVMCGAAGAPIAGVWSEAHAGAIAARLGGLQARYAIEGWPPARAALDAYASGWAAARVDACRATHVRGEQSPRLLDLRMRCLDRRLDALRCTVGALAIADESVAPHLFEIATSVQPVSSCSAEALVGPTEAPTDEPTARLVDEAEAHLARSRVLGAAGRLPEARAAAGEAVLVADRSGFAPMRAEALLERGVLEDRNEDPKAAESTLHEAAWGAEASHADHLAAAAWARLVSVIAYRQNRPAEAPRLARQAEAAIARVGGDDEARLVLLRALADVATHGYQPDEARARIEEMRVLVERVHGPESQPMAEVLDALSVADEADGKLEEALDLARRAHRITEVHFGSGHPVVASSLSAIRIKLLALGRFEESTALADRVLAIDTAAFGPSHARVGKALLWIAKTECELGRQAVAFPLIDRATAIYAQLGPYDMKLVNASVLRAECLLGLDRHREALPILEKARSYMQASLPAATFVLDPTIAHALEGLGRFSEACAAWRRFTESTKSSANLADRAEGLGGLGACLTKLGRAGEAVALLDEARALRAGSQGDPRQVGVIALDLARALRASRADPAKQRALAEQARDVGRAAGLAGARLARAAEVFLAR